MTLMTNNTLLACALALASGVSQAATAPVAVKSDCIDLHAQAAGAQVLELVRGKSVLRRFCSAASQVTVGAPEIANIVVPNAREVVIVARSVGSTNLIVSSRDGRSTVIDINVGIDTSALRAQFDRLFPQEKNIEISTSGSALILSGMVHDGVVASQLLALATAHHENAARPASAGASGGAAAGGAASAASAGSAGAAASSAPAASRGAAVLNMLTVAAPQQVLLEVKIAEVSKSLVDQFGSTLGLSKINGSWTYGIVSNLLAGTANQLGGTTQSGRKMAGVDGERRDGLVKILAEPTVMAVSGQEASFLAGGKIFIPVAQNAAGGASTVTLEEKEYGVAVKFTPTVLAGGLINLRVAPEVSELNREGVGVSAGSSNATAILPAFTTRRASTTVQLQDGESFAIGGLIRNNVTSNIKRFPFLGEMPVLGALFRSTDFQNDRTELVFIVTPHLAQPMPASPRLPTDDYVQPSRAELILGGQHEGIRPITSSKD